MKFSVGTAVGIVPSENAEVEELRDWRVDRGDIRSDPDIAREIFEFIEEHRVRSVAITDGIIGCPHQEGIDYDGEWCPVCEFWHGRDRFTGQRVHKILWKGSDGGSASGPADLGSFPPSIVPVLADLDSLQPSE